MSFQSSLNIAIVFKSVYAVVDQLKAVACAYSWFPMLRQDMLWLDYE